jgi:hypothetical protein
MNIGPYTVTLKEALTWGDVQEVQAVMAGGVKLGATGMNGYDARALLESKYKLLELAIVSITEGDKQIPFSREWMNGLSVNDGDTLYAAVEALSKKK